ncbi:DUF1642 domain-containing protein [Lactococcus petauri]|uniref:DUF1642 domain-containing protein n=1 Tax=Lactococcus petauri TaxID=1940789 RepID=UPI003854EBFA
MKKFEEEVKGKVETMATQPGCSMTRKFWYNADDIHELSKGWVSPEYANKLKLRNEQLDSENLALHDKIEKLQSQLDSQQPEIPEVPNFVADWYEKNKNNLEYEIFSINVDISDTPKEKWSNIESWFNFKNNKPIETVFAMKRLGYTLAKEKWFYLKHKSVIVYACECGCGNTDTDELYLMADGNFAIFKNDAHEFTQTEIDSMETGSCEKIPVGPYGNNIERVNKKLIQK